MFDRSDICEAYWVYAANYHTGQFSPEYAVFGRLDRMEFKPGLNLSEATLSENGSEIYMRLVMGQSTVRG
jgi:hypothetical protein